jgi:peroxiredoxin
MANNLTGDFQAVIQISVRQLNGILATIHQNRIDPDISPSFVHSTSMPIGKALQYGSTLETARFRQWASEASPIMAAGAESVQNARALLSGVQPAGLAQMYRDAWIDIDSGLFELPPTGAVRGRADLQISTPTISLSSRTASQVTVHAYVRAHFEPDPGGPSLPDPIHGEVRAVYTLQPKTLPDGRRVLRVQVSNEDSDIQFIAVPSTGMTAADVNEINGHVRAALRAKFEPLDVALDPDFAFAAVKSIGAGQYEAAVLPLQLSADAPGGDIASVKNQFLGTSEFAVAVSKDYIQAYFNQVIGTLGQYVAGFTYESTLADYTASLAYVNVVWKAGSIEISGKINLHTESVFADTEITFSQVTTVALDVPSQTVSIIAVGEPAVDEPTLMSHETAVNLFKNGRNTALTQASAYLNGQLGLQPPNAYPPNARTKLLRALQAFDNSATLRYTSVEVTPDGLIVRGDIGTRDRLSPVVHYDAVDGGRTLTALRSWIPGGRIEEIVWSWVEMTHPIPWFNKTKSHADPHRFVWTKPKKLPAYLRICLAIEGSQITANGWSQNVSAGETCVVHAHEPVLVAPIWWTRVMVPIWWPDPPVEIALDEIIAAHVNMVDEVRPPGSLAPNMLVHFTGPRIERPLEVLSQTLSLVRYEDMSLTVLLVLPAGSFASRRSEIEERLGQPSERFPAQLVITEDYQGGWTRAFAPTEPSSTHLINARGEFVWKQEGGLDPRGVASALDEHLLPAPGSQGRVLRLKVQAGEQAPDTVFADDRGNALALRRLRGRQVLMTFWQSWSSPCIRELQQLQQLHEQRGAPFILAICSGEEKGVLEEVRQRHNLTFPLIQDADQSIAMRYGIQCWPTTVSINRHGSIDRIQFGMSHQHREEAGRAKG